MKIYIAKLPKTLYKMSKQDLLKYFTSFVHRILLASFFREKKLAIEATHLIQLLGPWKL